jgi:hypothetical protein
MVEPPPAVRARKKGAEKGGGRGSPRARGQPPPEGAEKGGKGSPRGRERQGQAPTEGSLAERARERQGQALLESAGRSTPRSRENQDQSSPEEERPQALPRTPLSSAPIVTSSGTPLSSAPIVTTSGAFRDPK